MRSTRVNSQHEPCDGESFVAAHERMSKTLPPVARGIIAATISLLPVFLLGALAPFVQRELGIGESVFGFAVSAHFAVSALTVAFLGRVVDGRGTQFGLRWGLALTSSACAILVLAARGPGSVVVAMAVAGLGNALVSPTTSRILFEHARPQRMAITFGLKQAAITGGSLIGGLSLPTLVAVFGWRSAYLACLLAALVSAATAPVSRGLVSGERKGRRDEEARESRVSRRPVAGTPQRELTLMSLMFGFGIASLVSLSTFLVASLVSVGMSTNLAGAILALGAVGAIVSRLVLGWLADKRPERALGLTVACFLGGVVGFLLLSAGLSLGAAVAAVGALFAFASGWGWTGLILFDVAHRNAAAVAGATGRVQTGAGVGGALGPAVLGLVLERSGLGRTWLLAAGLMALALLISVYLEAQRRRAIVSEG